MYRLSFSTKQKVLQHSMIHTCSPDSLAAARCYAISIIAWAQIFMDLGGRSFCLHIHGPSQFENSHDWSKDPPVSTSGRKWGVIGLFRNLSFHPQAQLKSVVEV